EEGSYRKLNKQKGLESLGKKNRPVVFHSYKNTNNSNFSSEGIYYQELTRSSKASRSARQGSISRGPSKESKFSNPLYASDTELRIALHNINGLKANSQKMDA
ncbi:14079_t:CDS:2, partial [Gigaspora margarita]